MLWIIREYYTYFTTGWHTPRIIPPDELVEVIDEEGYILRVYPTYYDFEIIDDINIVSCKPYWDGCWMTYMNLEVKKPKRKICAWRRLKK